MKKFILATLLVAAIGTTAFALDVNKVSTRVQNSFESKFANAQNVQWTARETYTKVAFTLVDEDVEAFFASDGDLIGYSRKVAFKALPLKAKQQIKKKYNGFKVLESIEFTQNDETAYYVSVENDNLKKVLEVSIYGTVSEFYGNRKN